MADRWKTAMEWTDERGQRCRLVITDGGKWNFWLECEDAEGRKYWDDDIFNREDDDAVDVWMADLGRELIARATK